MKSKDNRPHEERTGVCTRAATVATAALLAVAFVMAGLFACCLPPTTTALSRAFSGSDNPATPFSHDQLVSAAEATRDYTVGTHDRAAIEGVLAAINREAETPLADPNKRQTEPDEVYTLDAEALSHLDDVYGVVSPALAIFTAVAVVAAGACVALGIRAGRRRLGEALLIGGTAPIVVFVPLALWALVDFNGLFAVFHSLFFAEGSWTFSSTSLLITMYPIAFWVGMGAVWLATTGGLSILAIAVGTALRRKPKTA